MLSKISNISFFKKSLRIPKGKSESVYRRRTDNTMVKRKNTKGQTMIKHPAKYSGSKCKLFHVENVIFI
jgi:hypothetical protein